MTDFISVYVGSNAFLGFVIDECHHKLLFVSLPLTFSILNLVNDYVFNGAFSGKVHLCFSRHSPTRMYFHQHKFHRIYRKLFFAIFIGGYNKEQESTSADQPFLDNGKGVTGGLTDKLGGLARCVTPMRSSGRPRHKPWIGIAMSYWRFVLFP